MPPTQTTAPRMCKARARAVMGRTPRFEALPGLHAAACAPWQALKRHRQDSTARHSISAQSRDACTTCVTLFRRADAAKALQQHLMKRLRRLHLRRVTEFREFDQRGIGNGPGGPTAELDSFRVGRQSPPALG